MNIGIDIRCLMNEHRTGVGEYAYQLLNVLFSIDKENEYFLFYNSYKDLSNNIPKWEQKNVHYVVTHWPNKLFNLFVRVGLIKLDKIIRQKANKQFNNSTIQQFNNLGFFFSPNLNFTSISKKTKFILTIHDLSFVFFNDFFSRYGRFWHWLVNPKKQCKRSEIILVVSENTKRDLINHYKIKPDKIKVIYPAVSLPNDFNLEDTIKKYNLPEKFILYLGTIEQRKNILGIIEAFKLSGLKKKGYRLILAGVKGFYSKDLLKNVDIEEGIQYLGYVNDKEKTALYKLAKVFVYPSFYEGFGLPVLEAMSCGLPVVTISMSSMPEVVGDSAYLVNPYNINEIANGLKNVLEDQKLRLDLINRGKRRAEEFSWGKSVESFLETIK